MKNLGTYIEDSAFKKKYIQYRSNYYLNCMQISFIIFIIEYIIIKYELL